MQWESTRWSVHGDIIKWKHFPRYCPFMREINQWLPLTKASEAELWCFLWRATLTVASDLRRHHVHYHLTVLGFEIGIRRISAHSPHKGPMMRNSFPWHHDLLIRSGWMAYICVGEIGHLWFRRWLVAACVPPETMLACCQLEPFYVDNPFNMSTKCWTLSSSLNIPQCCPVMMTSSNGNIFRDIDHLCGEFTGHRWIPHTKASDAELWCFLWSASE